MRHVLPLPLLLLLLVACSGSGGTGAAAPVVDAPSEADEPAGGGVPAGAEATLASANPGAAGPGAEAFTLPGDPVAGEVVYKANCLACHQADGTGMNGALGANFVGDPTRLSKTNDQLLGSIAGGVPGTAMIAWEKVLTEQQRKDALSYIRSTFGKK